MKFKNPRAARPNMQMNFNTASGGDIEQYLSIKPATSDNKVKATNIQSNTENRQIWGKHIWMFIHGLCAKLKPEYFLQLRGQLLEHLRMICTNLPCPDCSKHADEYMKNVNVSSIMSNRDLVLYFYTFHNAVNARKGYPAHKVEDLEIYNKANLKNMYKNFTYYFKEQYHSPRLMADSFHRKRAFSSFEKWLQTHTECFNL